MSFDNIVIFVEAINAFGNIAVRGNSIFLIHEHRRSFYPLEYFPFSFVGAFIFIFKLCVCMYV